jgi:hypothetical protein
MIFSPGDPEIEKLLSLPLEERKRKYPTLYWPSEDKPNDAVGSGRSHETLSLDPAAWGAIWIDLDHPTEAKQ